MAEPIYQSNLDRVPDTAYPYVHMQGAGDFDGDGSIEFIATFTNFGQVVANRIAIFGKDSAGSYVDQTSEIISSPIPEMYQGRAILIEDFNGDGKSDIFIADSGPDLIRDSPGAQNVLLLSSGNKLVNATSTLPQVLDFTHTVAAGDIDGDNDLDIFVGNFTSMRNSFAQPYFLLNDGLGNFTMSTVTVPSELRDDGLLQIGASSLGDFTGDGKVDLLIGSHVESANLLYRGDGSGDFSNVTPTELPIQLIGGRPGDAVWMHSFDMNNDGLLDVAISYYGWPSDFNDPYSYAGRAVQVLMSKGNGDFDDVSHLFPLAALDDGHAPAQWFVKLDSADLNGDGYQDLYANNLNGGGTEAFDETPVVWLSNGVGGYSVLTQESFGSAFNNGHPSSFEFVDNLDIFSISWRPELLERTGSFGEPRGWYQREGDVALVASTYQFFTDRVPTAQGFEYLIDSGQNANDLNDPYYAQFNMENRYINFASNLGTSGEGAAFFETNYDDLSFEDAVMAVYQEILGKPLSGDALTFFLDAEGFYQGVAEARVVRPGVDLDDAIKIVAIGSILNEAVKAGSGPYGVAVEKLVADLYVDGQSTALGGDLFALV